MTYHLNPETGRPNICRASIRECRFGSSSQHFETKQDATAFAEKQLSETFGNLSTLTKDSQNSSNASEVKTLDQIANELGVPSEDEMRSLVRERVKLYVTSRELERLDDEKDRYSSVTFHAYYRRMGPMSLDYNDWDTVQVFTKGACGLVSLEINRVTGLPITLFTQDPSSKYWSGHASVKLPNGEYFDIEGAQDRRQILSGFENSKDWVEEEVSHKDFKKMMGLKEKKLPNSELGALEKAALAKICFDLIRDHKLNEL